MRQATPIRAVRSLVALWLAAAACGQPAPPASDSPSTTFAATARGVKLQEGDPAPDFSLPGSDGRTYSLASYKGRQAVVLAWFSKAFTDG